VRNFHKVLLAKIHFSPKENCEFFRFKHRHFPKSEIIKTKTKLSSSRRRKERVRLALATGGIVAFEDINVIDSKYKVQYKHAKRCIAMFVNKEQFVLVYPGTELYDVYEPSSVRPHPQIKKYLEMFVAKRRLYENKVLVQQQEIEIEKLMNGYYKSLVTPSYEALVKSKVLDKEVKLSTKIVHRGGKHRPSKMKRSANFKILGIKKLKDISLKKRNHLKAQVRKSSRLAKHGKTRFPERKKRKSDVDHYSSELKRIREEMYGMTAW